MSTVTRTITIRAAHPHDAAALATLQQAIYKEEHWFVGDGAPAAEALSRRLRFMDEHMSLYAVALPATATRPEQSPGILGKLKADVRPQVICGWLELHRHHPEKLQHVAVLTLAVHKDWRQQGVAKQLLAYGYRWARQVGVEKISLNVRASNSAAIHLYETEGFAYEGRERKHIRLNGAYEDNIIMGKFMNETNQQTKQSNT